MAFWNRTKVAEPTVDVEEFLEISGQQLDQARRALEAAALKMAGDEAIALLAKTIDDHGKALAKAINIHSASTIRAAEIQAQGKIDAVAQLERDRQEQARTVLPS